MIHQLRIGLGIAAMFALSVAVEARDDPGYLRGDELYQHGKGDPADFPDALVAFKAAAERGDAKSQFYAGRMYQLGHGVAVDLKQAAHWYELAVEQGHTGACNNLANVYAAQKRSEKEILASLFRGAELGDPLVAFNLAQYSKSGTAGVRKNYARAVEYYRKALELRPGYPTAWNHIGTLYNDGGFGLQRDYQAAEEAYLKAIETDDNPHAYYNLYRIYNFGHRPEQDKPALYYLEGAAERGLPEAAWRAAHHHLNGWGGSPQDPVRAAHFFDLGAQAKHGACMLRAAELAGNPSVVERYGEAATRTWVERLERRKESARQDVATDLAAVRPVFDGGDEAEAGKAMDRAMARWSEQTADHYFFWHADAVWHEAQVRSGRSDPEWGRFLFTWLTQTFEADDRSNNILGARINLHAKLVETGRYGLLRDSCETTKQLLLALEGIDIDAVLSRTLPDANYAFSPSTNIPIETDPDLARRSRTVDYDLTVESAGPIGGQAMTALRDIAGERLSVGDWQSVLVIAEWLGRWCHHFNETGGEPPRAYPGCLRELEQASAELRADVFEALGLPEREAAAWQSIIDMNYTDSYGGRLQHLARYRLAGIRLADGNATEVQALERLEVRMRENPHEGGEDWQYTKLVRARAIAATGTEGVDRAISLTDEVLASASQNKRPLLRLEALLVAADLKLNAGITDGVESALEEALGWARSKGLLLKELRVVQLYVTYLVAIGDLDGALAMQRRVLELVDALRLSPRHQAALLRLAEIYSLLSDPVSALQIAKQITEPALLEQAKRIAKPPERSVEPVPTKLLRKFEPVDLQPMAIRSATGRDDSEAIFMLINPNPGPRQVQAVFDSAQFQFVREEAAEGELAIRAELDERPRDKTLTIQATVPGSSQLPLIVTAINTVSLRDKAQVALRVGTSGVADWRSSEWEIAPDGGGALVSVIDAAQLRNNAFSLVPVFHHFEVTGPGPAQAAIRIVASSPTRVEGFSSNGTLLFVDAQGNGSFRDAGDLVATDTMDDLFPVLAADSDLRVALRYRPVSPETDGRVELQIQSRDPGKTGAWQTNAIDWLEPSRGYTR